MSPTYGHWIKFSITQPCPACRASVDLAPGQLDPAANLERRTCPECGADVLTEPLFSTPLSSADVQFES